MRRTNFEGKPACQVVRQRTAEVWLQKSKGEQFPEEVRGHCKCRIGKLMAVRQVLVTLRNGD